MIWSWTVRYVLFWEWNLDVFWIVSTTLLVQVQFCYVFSCGYFWFHKVSSFGFGSVFSTSLRWTASRMLAWHLLPPRFRVAYPKHFFGFYWSLCAIDSQLICKLTRHLNATFPRRLPLDFLVGHVLVCVYPCGRCAIVALLPRIAKLPKKSQNNGFKICEMSWVNILLLFWMRATFGQLEMIWVGVWSNNQHQFNF